MTNFGVIFWLMVYYCFAYYITDKNEHLKLKRSMRAVLERRVVSRQKKAHLIRLRRKYLRILKKTGGARVGDPEAPSEEELAARAFRLNILPPEYVARLEGEQLRRATMRGFNRRNERRLGRRGRR
jgi:hypothetical protein